MSRTINFETISWFWDLYNRELLDLDPHYQRRSVWNQDYKDYFIDTVLNGHPEPAIFIYQEIIPQGVSKVSIVDGKQRLSTLFQFAIEYLPSSDEQVTGNIFDRINRNVSKLTPQEIRHARFNGIFITIVEELTTWMFNYLGKKTRIFLTSMQLRKNK